MVGTCDTARVRERCSTIVRYVDVQIFDPVVFMIYGFTDTGQQQLSMPGVLEKTRPLTFLHLKVKPEGDRPQLLSASCQM